MIESIFACNYKEQKSWIELLYMMSHFAASKHCGSEIYELPRVLQWIDSKKSTAFVFCFHAYR